jgi:hypothetical protein
MRQRFFCVMANNLQDLATRANEQADNGWRALGPPIETDGQKPNERVYALMMMRWER